MILKSTQQPVHLVPWSGQGDCPWPTGYERVLIPNPHGVHHLQIVRKDSLAKE